MKEGLKHKNNRLILIFCRNHVALTRVEGQEKKEQIQKEVRQGCSLSPLTFTMASKRNKTCLRQVYKPVPVQEERKNINI